MGQITLDDSANNYANEWGDGELEKDLLYAAFVNGAQWQKEQTKEIARNLIGLEAWVSDPSMKLLLSNIIEGLMK